MRNICTFKLSRIRWALVQVLVVVSAAHYGCNPKDNELRLKKQKLTSFSPRSAAALIF